MTSTSFWQVQISRGEPRELSQTTTLSLPNQSLLPPYNPLSKWRLANRTSLPLDFYQFPPQSLLDSCKSNRATKSSCSLSSRIEDVKSLEGTPNLTIFFPSSILLFSSSFPFTSLSSSLPLLKNSLLPNIHLSSSLLSSPEVYFPPDFFNLPPTPPICLPSHSSLSFSIPKSNLRRDLSIQVCSFSFKL